MANSSYTDSPLHLGLSELTSAFTNAYLNIIQELIKYETPGHAVFGNKGNMIEWGKGVEATFPTRKPARRGIVGDRSNQIGRIPRGGSPSYSMAKFKAMTHRLAINFDWNSMNTASNERYVANLVKNALSDVKDQWNRRQNIWLYGGELGDRRRRLIGANGAEKIWASATDDDCFASRLGDGCVAILASGASSGQADLVVKLPHTIGTDDGGNSTLDTACFNQAGALWLQPGDFILILDTTSGAGTSGRGEIRQISSISRAGYVNNPTAGDSMTGSATITLTENLTNAYATAYTWTGTGGSDTAPQDTGTMIYLASPQATGPVAAPTASAPYGTNNELIDTDVVGAYPGFGTITGPMHRCQPGDAKQGNSGGSGAGIPDYLQIGRDQYWSSTCKNLAAAGGGAENGLAPIDFLALDKVLHENNALRHRRPDTLFMNPQMWMEWVEEANANHAFRNSGSLTPTAGLTGGNGTQVSTTFQSVSAVTGIGTMDVIIDPFCPPYTIYAVDKGNVGYMERFPLTVANDDGSDFRFAKQSFDVLESFLRVVSTFVSMHPGSVTKITGIAQSGVPVL